MDEFANVALPDEFDKLLSTMRSREISVSIIIQNLAQLKALFEKQWESIVGNCDEFLYLGGNEQSTHEYVSKLLGKETIDTNSYGQSKGRNGSYSTNWQLAGRELMTPDEVRMLDNRYALLFIRGERPVEDLKFDILKHPNIALTTDGGAEPYRHGEDSISIAALSMVIPLAFNFMLTAMFVPAVCPDPSYLIWYAVNGASLMSELYYTYPDVYVLLYLVIDFFFCGLIACLSYSISTIYKNRVVVVLLPFFLLLGFNFIGASIVYTSNLIRYTEFSPIYFLHPAAARYDAGWNVILIEALILFVLTFVPTVIKGKGNEIY